MTGEPKWANPMLGPVVPGSTHERRVTVSNDNEVVDGTAPPSNRSAANYGKFFPRGMRGIIEEIKVYCKGNGHDSLIVSISPQPGLGPTYTVTITPVTTWAWRNIAFNVMWNYDSVYIWISTCGAAVFWGYDDGRPRDGHLAAGGGATFTDLDERPFFRAVVTGATVGDLPVSGTVNTVQIPATSALNYFVGVAAPNGIEVTLADLYGAGELLYIFVAWGTTVVPTGPLMYQFNIYIDDQPSSLQIWNSLLTQFAPATAGRCEIGVFWQDDIQTYMVTWLKLPFKRHLKVTTQQFSGGTRTMYGWVVPAMIK